METSRGQAAGSHRVGLRVAAVSLAVVSLVLITAAVTGGLPSAVALVVLTPTPSLVTPLPLAIALLALACVAGAVLWLASRAAGAASVVMIVAAGLGGVAIPALIWQLGLPEVPAGIDAGTQVAHVSLAIAAVLAPALWFLIAGLRARTTYALQLTTRTWSTADGRSTMPPASTDSDARRQVRAISLRLDRASRHAVAVDVSRILSAHTVTHAPPQGYQFELPNGAMLTLADIDLEGRRTLLHYANLQLPGFLEINRIMQRPQRLPVEGPWFDGRDPRYDAALTRQIAECIETSFRSQDPTIHDGYLLDRLERWKPENGG